MNAPHTIVHNKLLASLAADDLAVLKPHLQRIDMRLRQELERPGEKINRIVFPESGLLSVIAMLPRGRDIEVGIIGRDGMTGIALTQDDDQSPFVTLVQIEGEGLAIDAGPLRKILEENRKIRSVFSRYARFQTIQLGATALANGRAKLEERLARWLLMVQDRIDDDRINLTHEFLSIMLGVRRPGVTVALHMLEGKGYVRSNRGEIIIRDREGLMDLADGAYGMAEGEYRRLMGMPS